MKRLALCLLLAAGCSKSNVVNQDNRNTTNNFISQVVGAQGAKLDHPSGASVNIPPGALTSEVELRLGTVEAAMVPALPAGVIKKSEFYATEPSNQTFALDVVLNVPHTAGANANPILLRADPGGAWSAFPTSLIAANFLQAELKAFGLYVVVNGGGDSPDASSFGQDASAPPRAVCGDNMVTAGTEDCDYGDDYPGDGCDENCKRELEWECDMQGCLRIGERLSGTPNPGPIWVTGASDNELNAYYVTSSDGADLVSAGVSLDPGAGGGDPALRVTDSVPEITSVSVNSSHVYWVENRTAIVRASLGDFTKETFVAAGTETVFRALSNETEVLWTEGLTNPSGGKVRSLATSMPGGTPTNFGGIDEMDPIFMAIGDSTRGLVYTVHTSSGAVKLNVSAMSYPVKSARNATDLVGGVGLGGLALAWIEENGTSGTSEVHAVTIPVTWMPGQALPPTAKIGDADLVAPSGDTARDNRLFIDGGFVYWSNPDAGTIVRAPMTGATSPETIIDIGPRGTTFQPTAIFVWRGRVYFASQGDGHRHIAIQAGPG